MSQRRYGEKEEKEEKQHEKDEKSAQEKSIDEKWRRDPVSAAVWGVILIWGGLVWLASNFKLFEDTALEGWALFFLGAGVILLLEVAFRLLLPAYRQAVLGTVILGVVFLAIVIFAVVVVAIGIVILLRGLFGSRGAE
jgi:ABC-type Mn2+/Zn2+ transport system permease subunit